MWVLVLHAAAQDKPISSRNSFYLEAAGKGALYSLNYERIFNQHSRFKKSFRVGAGVFKNTIAMPLGISFFKGEPPHYIEYSMLFTPYIEHYQELFNGKNSSDKKAYVMPGVGYRYQPLRQSFFAKITAGPALYLDPPSDNFWKMQTKWYAGLNIAAGISW